jgi:hypothetical protein
MFGQPGDVALVVIHELDDHAHDCCTGGPVGVWHFRDIHGNTFLARGTIEEFVGVYSGRINEESDLGFVWKASVVREIVDNGVRGIVSAP